MNTIKLAAAVTLAALTSGVALAQNSTMQQSKDKPAMEKCYGVAMAGQNDCKAEAGTTCAGTQKTDYERDHFKSVPVGTCATIKTPHGMGTLKPM
ncbi:BufA1 family periplasmic bufferin-type metallophore [Cupriavidus metallidurans]